MNLTLTSDLPVPFEPLPLASRRARCADGNGTLTDLFFSLEEIDIARARAICRPCPLAERCLSGAIERGEAYGVWGGALLVDGVPVDRIPRRGRPAARRLDEFVVDEVRRPGHLVA